MSRFPDDFYGFPEIPLHIHLGMRFLRPDPEGPAVVTMPPGPEFADEDGRQSVAAVYTVGEVAAGIEVCDALVLNAAEEETSMIPLVLTRETKFTPRARARGEIRSETSFVGDSSAAIGKLRGSRKVMVQTEARLYDEDDTLAGEMVCDFYVRLMDRSRLEAMAGALTPTMAGKARTETVTSGGAA